jgi:hypothetical protein
MDKVPDADFLHCNSSSRNLWVTVTRTQAPKLESSEFLTPRQLQALNYDVEFGFQVIQGGSSGAMNLIVLSLALIASLSVFIF